MKAAIYTRVSTDEQREASLDDQERECRDLAETEGLTVVEVFSDFAHSGHETMRPDYQRMLAAARRRQFDVVIAHDTDRLWRNEAEMHTVVEEFDYAGLRVIDCKGIDTGNESARILLSIHGWMARQESIKTSRRTHRALKGLAIRGLSTGGKCYGYRPAGGAESKRTVDADQAKTVVWIFERFRDGASTRAIANELNSRGVPSPGASWNRKHRRRDGRWMQSAMYYMLRNRTYLGEAAWNKTKSRKKPKSSRRRFDPRDKDQWIVGTDPELRIVSDELWKAVQARIARRTREIGENVKRGLSKHQAVAVGRGRAPKYLLSTLLVCDSCGSRLVIAGAKGASYACSGWLNGGESACPNRVRVSRVKVEERVLEGVRQDLLSDESVAAFRKDLRAALRERSKSRRQAERSKRGRRKDLEAEIGRLVDGIASGTIPADGAIGARLRAAEEELARIQGLKSAPECAPEEALIVALPRYRQIVADLTRASGARIGEARDMLRQLLGEVRVAVDATGRPVARLGLQVSDGSGGRI